MIDIDSIDDIGIKNHIIIFIEVTCKIIQELISETNPMNIIELMYFLEVYKNYEYKNYYILVEISDYAGIVKLDRVFLNFKIIKIKDGEDWSDKDIEFTIKRKVYSKSKERMKKIEKLKLL